MFTILLSFVLLVPLVILPLAAQGWLFKDSDEVYDPEWELYQQRHD